MSEAMWFVLGVLCAVAVFFCLPREKHPTDVERLELTQRMPSKEWAETRNFLYYDGTVMPEIKEDLNEQ